MEKISCIVFPMNRAQLFLWSLLHSDEHVDDGVLAALADQGGNRHAVLGHFGRRNLGGRALVRPRSDHEDVPSPAVRSRGSRNRQARRRVSAQIRRQPPTDPRGRAYRSLGGTAPGCALDPRAAPLPPAATFVLSLG